MTTAVDISEAAVREAVELNLEATVYAQVVALRSALTARDRLLRVIEATLPHMGGNAMSTHALLTDIRTILAKETTK
jgi:hypothetical protein